MKQRKIPLRSCVVTKEQCPKGELIRIVKDKEGNVFLDLVGKANGRGAYIKKDLATVEKAKKTKALNKALRTNISEEIYEQLENIIKN